ncbi:MAG: SUMF1/EgtB/PvdO family nonheme iron enzyme [Planctomycetia bacterium]|nr:SUMF1/EgtB/PvdO family nonheme iron enzyme [Planctomycetia bacterium]
MESEWEYACRAGTTTPWSNGSETDSLDAVAWFADNSDETTHPVGEKEPNAWGLHDMHGNVGEWVLDQLAPEGYARQAALPQPVPEAAAAVWPTSLSPRVVRGGSYYDEPPQCRSAARRGSEDLPWKDVDPNLPKSPWWYTEEPALGVGMRVVRPLAVPDIATRRRWGDADIDSIRADTADRLMQGRGARGVVDPKLPADLKAEGITN